MKKFLTAAFLGLACAASAATPYRLGIAGYTFCSTKLDPSLEIMKQVDNHLLCVKDFHLKYSATDAEIAAFKQKLASFGVEAVAAGPLYCATEKDARMLFDFAKRYGMKTVVGVPYEVAKGQSDKWNQRVESDQMLDIIEKFVKEYDIRFAIHNHGPDAPTLFPTAESVMKRIAHRDARIGLCLDVCHEQRSGKDPVATIYKYGDRIYDVHVNNILFKNVKRVKGKVPYTPVPGGRGDMDLPGIFRALAEIGYAGVCHIEYGRNHGNGAKELHETVAYMRGCMDTVVEPTPTFVPPLLKTNKNQPVKTVEDWEKVRRPELLEFFRANVYGRRPVQRPEGLTFEQLGADEPVLNGTAIKRRVKISWKGAVRPGSFTAVAYLPAKRTRKVPAFVFLNLAFKQYAVDETLPTVYPFWPVQDILARGYATVKLDVGEVAPDTPETDFGKDGVYGTFTTESNRAPDSWGTLSAWGWGASRVLDWIETQPEFDASRVAVAGHSRGGKTAMWCACEDTRFAMACVNDSGCGGAKFNNMDLPKSEQLGVGGTDFNYWYCRNYTKFAGWERTPHNRCYDQHQALALIAPRLLCVASASLDAWAGPRGEYWSARLASPAWELYGQKGLVTTDFPAPDTAQQEGRVSYHLRPGPHGFRRSDWGRYLDFADRHGWNK